MPQPWGHTFPTCPPGTKLFLAHWPLALTPHGSASPQPQIPHPAGCSQCHWFYQHLLLSGAEERDGWERCEVGSLGCIGGLKTSLGPHLCRLHQSTPSHQNLPDLTNLLRTLPASLTTPQIPPALSIPPMDPACLLPRLPPPHSPADITCTPIPRIIPVDPACPLQSPCRFCLPLQPLQPHPYQRTLDWVAILALSNLSLASLNVCT